MNIYYCCYNLYITYLNTANGESYTHQKGFWSSYQRQKTHQKRVAIWVLALEKQESP